MKNLVLNSIRSVAASSCPPSSFNTSPHPLPPSEGPDPPPSSASSSSEPVASTAPNSSSSAVQINAMDSKWTAHCGLPKDYEPCDRAPSYDLTQKCPLCFPLATPDVFTRYLDFHHVPTKGILTLLYRGSYSGPHSYVCLDGCFQHKRCRWAGSGDQAIPKAQTYFLTPEEVLEVRKYSDSLKSSSKNSASSNANEAELSMPSYVYDGCSTRFIAANESKAKAEASLFEDTGLMALTCRHDRVLFMVTLKDPGERQYNALALLKALFHGLPSYWRVGVLYDIGCQVHRSLVKVGISHIRRGVYTHRGTASTIYSRNLQVVLLGGCPPSTPLHMRCHARSFITRRRGLVLGTPMVRAVSGFGQLYRS